MFRARNLSNSVDPMFKSSLSSVCQCAYSCYQTPTRSFTLTLFSSYWCPQLYHQRHSLRVLLYLLGFALRKYESVMLSILPYILYIAIFRIQVESATRHLICKSLWHCSVIRFHLERLQRMVAIYCHLHAYLTIFTPMTFASGTYAQ